MTFDLIDVWPLFILNLLCYSDKISWAMPYDVESFQYVAEDGFDTTDHLGPITLSYTFTTEVYPIGPIVVKMTDSKRIGYNLEIDDTAVTAGRELLPEDSVVPGTDFTFGLTLATGTQPTITQGDFVVKMSVTDSSGVVQHTEDLDASTNR